MNPYGRVPDWLLFDKTVSERTKLVYAALSYHANNRGEAWPAVETLAKELGIGESTVRRAIRQLAAAGRITVRPGHGRTHTNVYVLAAEDIPNQREKVSPQTPFTARKGVKQGSEKVSPQIPDPLRNQSDAASAGAASSLNTQTCVCGGELADIGSVLVCVRCHTETAAA